MNKALLAGAAAALAITCGAEAKSRDGVQEAETAIKHRIAELCKDPEIVKQLDHPEEFCDVSVDGGETWTTSEKLFAGGSGTLGALTLAGVGLMIRRRFKQKNEAFDAMFQDADKNLDVIIPKDILKELYPRGLWEGVKQGQVGDCYIVAAIQAVKEGNPRFFERYIREHVTKVDNGWVVRFLWLSWEKNETLITEQELEDKDLAGAPLGDRILQRAYRRLRKIRQGEGQSTHDDSVQDIHFLWSGETPIMKNEADPSSLVYEGWYTLVVLRDLFDLDTKLWNMSDLEARDESMASLTKGAIAITGSCSSNRLSDTNDDTTLVDICPGHQIFANHAYALLYNPQTETLMFVNPHDTKGERFEVTLENMRQSFSPQSGYSFYLSFAYAQKSVSLQSTQKQIPPVTLQRRVQKPVVKLGNPSKLVLPIKPMKPIKPIKPVNSIEPTVSLMQSTESTEFIPVFLRKKGK